MFAALALLTLAGTDPQAEARAAVAVQVALLKLHTKPVRLVTETAAPEVVQGQPRRPFSPATTLATAAQAAAGRSTRSLGQGQSWGRTFMPVPVGRRGGIVSGCSA